jgi:hypothetical protein
MFPTVLRFYFDDEMAKIPNSDRSRNTSRDYNSEK